MPNANGEFSASEIEAMRYQKYNNPRAPKPKPTEPNLYDRPTPPPVDPLKAKNDEMVKEIMKEHEAEVLRRMEAEKLKRHQESFN